MRWWLCASFGMAKLISQAFRTFLEFFRDSSHMDLYHMTTSANQHNSRYHEAE